MFNSPALLRHIFTATLVSVLQKSKKLYPPLTHNSVPSGGANKQGSLNDMGLYRSLVDWNRAYLRGELGGDYLRHTSPNGSLPMKIHNASDKFVKVHGKSLARAVANLLSKPQYSCVGSIISIWLQGNRVLANFDNGDRPMKVNRINFELTRDPQSFRLELTPADEESLLLIQEWEELNEDAYNDQDIY